jgi:hypothetical protein
MKSQIRELADLINKRGVLSRSKYIEHIKKVRGQVMDNGLWHARILEFNKDPTKHGYPLRVRVVKKDIGKEQVALFGVDI